MKNNYLITESDSLKLLLKSEVIDKLYKTKDWKERFVDYFEKVLTDREYIIDKLFKNNKCEDTIIFPIGFNRIITKVSKMFNLSNIKYPSDLNPLYILDSIDTIIQDIELLTKTTSTKLLTIVLRHYLSPKKLLFQHKFTKQAFEFFIEHIKQKYVESLVNPLDN